MIIDGQPLTIPFNLIDDRHVFEIPGEMNFQIYVKAVDPRDELGTNPDQRDWNAFNVETGDRLKVELTLLCRVWPQAKLKLNGD